MNQNIENQNPKSRTKTQNGESKTKIENQKPKLRTKYQNQEPKASLDPAMLSYLFQSLCLALYGCTCALWKLSCDSPSCIQFPQVHLVSSSLNTYISILVQTCKVSTNDTSSCSEIRTSTLLGVWLIIIIIIIIIIIKLRTKNQENQKLGTAAY